jgi:zinc protease
MMSRGSENLDYQQLQDELTRLRAELSMNSTIGVLQTRIKTKREFLPEVITLLGDLLRRPRLEASELEVLRRQIVTSLQQSSTEPQALAPRYVRKTLAPYPADDVRYVKTIDEEIAMYEAVTIDEIRALYENFLSNQSGELAVVGDFDPEEVKALLKTQLEDWKTSQPYERVDQDPHPGIAGSTKLIETPDKANAVYYSSQQYALSDEDPAYASLVMGNYILGGGSLSNRLANRVRQKEGLSYGVGSGVSAKSKDDRVDFTIYAITNPENQERLSKAIREELDRLREQGVTEDELEMAKQAYLQKARVDRTNDSALAAELVGTIFNERTMEYLAEHEQQIEDATVDSVNQAVRSYIVPEKLVTGIAGDFAKAAEEKEQKVSTETGDAK